MELINGSDVLDDFSTCIPIQYPWVSLVNILASSGPHFLHLGLKNECSESWCRILAYGVLLITCNTAVWCVPNYLGLYSVSDFNRKLRAEAPNQIVV